MVGVILETQVFGHCNKDKIYFLYNKKIYEKKIII